MKKVNKDLESTLKDLSRTVKETENIAKLDIPQFNSSTHNKFSTHFVLGIIEMVYLVQLTEGNIKKK